MTITKSAMKLNTIKEQQPTMTNIFEHLGFEQASQPTNENQIELLVIDNNDGTPRWIWPAKAKYPYFLKFYNVSNTKSLLLKWFAQIIFMLRLQSLVFKKHTAHVTSVKGYKRKTIDIRKDNWALFTGTPGVNNKIILYHVENEKGIFYKVSTSEASRALLDNEKNVLNRLYSIWPSDFIVPEILNDNPDNLKMEDVSIGSKRENRFGEIHLNALYEIYSKTSFTMQMNEVELIQDAKAKIALWLKSADSRIPNGLIRKLNLLTERLEEKNIEVGLAHSDFTPWNTYVREDKLVIYDWELSHPFLPIGYDAFHFIIQNGILVDKKPWKQISAELHNLITTENFSKLSKFGHANVDEYLKYYMILNVTKHIELYSKQEKWHTQIHWLLQAWDDSLSEILGIDNNNRQLLVIDVFDFLNEKKYAAIKFPSYLPENLSEYSDIDLCIERKDVHEIEKFLKDHPLVAGCRHQKKSYMQNIQIVLKDASFLSLDLIWDFRRKSMIMMDATNVLDNAYRNAFNVKVMDPLNLTRYLGLFYGLNKSKVPAKYEAYEMVIERSKEQLDQLIYSAMIGGESNQVNLKKFISRYPRNRGFNRILNQLQYLSDTARTMFSSRGLIVTFSGVDGAGKSTIIENIKLELEKRLRKNVVVLRHRPSLLPIISSFTKGKKQAEADAAKKLPRQGNNKSTLSSALRFGYYFADYLIGQFYIHVRYKLRGKVVLYDRYYFDFIVDAKRSNINLSEKTTRFAYRFLLKPDINFFLYADTKTILRRKRELSESDIIELTTRYNKLFNELNEASTDNATRYHSIENNDLRETIDAILFQTIKIAA